MPWRHRARRSVRPRGFDRGDAPPAHGVGRRQRTHAGARIGGARQPWKFSALRGRCKAPPPKKPCSFSPARRQAGST
jgi:hypothetical protein